MCKALDAALKAVRESGCMVVMPLGAGKSGNVPDYELTTPDGKVSYGDMAPSGSIAIHHQVMSGERKTIDVTRLNLNQLEK